MKGFVFVVQNALDWFANRANASLSQVGSQTN